MVRRSGLLLCFLGLAGAQDLFLATSPKLASANASCIPDWSCAAPHDASQCCSGKHYKVTEAVVECEWGNQGMCDGCKHIVDVVANELKVGVTCDLLNDKKSDTICADIGLSNALLLPLCKVVLEKTCGLVQSLLDKGLGELDVAVCEKGLRMCSGGKGSQHFCGCLEAGECANPFYGKEQCCSGDYKILYPFEHCDKKHHNLPAPAKCT
eukprot:TRINITY_DN412_c0_g1_i5.p1 TRINITY_DN412_c0_g1~~TRINITY_DN412_c0_g1_i5.p1  ORF type:complete len:231 (+),score=25.74 TRINITY_DN412_c0_g1_i5:64-693(+)